MKQTLETHRKMLTWVGLCAALLAGSLVLIGFAVRQSVQDQRNTDRVVCRAINRFDVVVIATLHRSQRDIPRLAYFREHPAELRAQLAEIRRQIRLFAPTHCH